MTEALATARQSYLTNVAASLTAAAALVRNEPVTYCHVSGRWVSDWEREADIIVRFELPALRVYDC